jgi:hypothetical protein
MEDPEEHLIIDDVPVDQEVRWHTIYHIPGVKVGCTVDFKKRKTQYEPGTVFEVLENIECTALVAGDREWYWADKFGYPKGPHYSENNWNVNMTPEQRSEAGRAGIVSQLTSGNHNTQTGKSGYYTGAAGRSGIASQIANEIHCSQTGRTGFQTMASEQKSEAGKIGGKIGGAIVGRKLADLGKTYFQNISREEQQELARRSAASPNHTSKQVRTCPHCGFTGKGAWMFRRHFNNCPEKKPDGSVV